MTIGRNIREYREALGWTQAELGRRLDTTGAVVAHWEKGRRTPRLETLQRIAKTLGVEPGTLLDPVLAR